jgi:hypothetical protein
MPSNSPEPSLVAAQPSPRIGIAATGLLVAIGIILGVTGYWMLFTSFAPYDDEGYVLITARNHFAHGGLYDTIYTQYGPAFYAGMDLVQFLLGSPMDNQSARLLTLGLWLGTAISAAGLVARTTRSTALGVFTLTTTFLYLYFLIDEPFHPGGPIVFLITCPLWLAAEAVHTNRPRLTMVVLGVTGATLFLMKVNVGVFYFAGVAAWLLPQITPAHHRKKARWVVITGLIVLAAGLMHGLARESWVQIYLVVFGCGVAALALTNSPAPIATTSRGRLGIMVAAAGATTVVVLLVLWLRGTSPNGILEGVLLGPLRHPGSYSYPVDWRPGSLFVAVLSLALAGIHWRLRAVNPTAADRLLIGLRLIQFIGLLAGIVLLMKLRVIGAVFSYEAVLIWTWVTPLSGGPENSKHQSTRSLLAWVLLLQYLHAYPVGGSQVSWGSFLFLPLVALGLDDLRRRLGFVATWRGAAVLVVATLLTKTAWTANRAWREYDQREDLGLPGAGGLRLTEDLRTTYRTLCLNAAIHADMLFTMPGMFSFNIWTDLPTPTLRNTTLWFTLLNVDEQEAIIRALKAADRPCVIVQETQLYLLRSSQVPITGPLVDHIRENYTVAFRLDGFALLTRAGNRIAPVDVAQTSRADDYRYDTQIEFNLLSAGTTVASIEVRRLAPGVPSMLLLDDSNTRISSTAINRAGLALHRPTDKDWPWEVNGMTRVVLKFYRGDLELSPVTTVLHLKDIDGETIGQVRIVE